MTQAMGMDEMAIQIDRSGLMTAVELADGQEPPPGYDLKLVHFAPQKFDIYLRNPDSNTWLLFDRLQLESPPQTPHQKLTQDLITNIFSDQDGSFLDQNIAKARVGELYRLEQMAFLYKGAQKQLADLRDAVTEYRKSPGYSFEGTLDILIQHAMHKSILVQDDVDVQFMLAAHMVFDKLFGATIVLEHDQLSKMPENSFDHLKYAFKYFAYLTTKKLLEVQILMTEGLPFPDRLVQLTEALETTQIRPYTDEKKLLTLKTYCLSQRDLDQRTDNFDNMITAIYESNPSEGVEPIQSIIPGLWAPTTGEA